MAAGSGSGEWSITEWYSLAHVSIIVGIAVFFGRTLIKSALESRRDGVRKRLVETKNQLAQLRAEIEQSREKIRNIDREKQELIARVEGEGRRLSEKLISEAEKTAERIVQDAKLAAQSEVESYKNKLRQEVVDRAVEQTIAALAMDRKNNSEMSQKLHSQLVEKFVKEASRVLHV